MTGHKFEKQLEYHKIPEYYDQYFRYGVLKSHLRTIKTKIQSNLDIFTEIEFNTGKLMMLQLS